MAKTVNIKDLRKVLRSIGFKIKTQSLSFGTSAEIIRISDNEKLPNVFIGEEHRKQWQPVIDCITGITVVNDTDKISGPWSSMK